MRILDNILFSPKSKVINPVYVPEYVLDNDDTVVLVPSVVVAVKANAACVSVWFGSEGSPVTPITSTLSIVTLVPGAFGLKILMYRGSVRFK